MWASGTRRALRPHDSGSCFAPAGGGGVEIKALAAGPVVCLIDQKAIRRILNGEALCLGHARGKEAFGVTGKVQDG